MPPCLVSVVVDNFNYGRYLAQAISSALDQTHPRIEVVVVDDASTDGSREVIRSFGNRVVQVMLDRNGGQGAAFNAGFRAARGDVIVFLDSDDYLHPFAAATIAAAWSPGLSRLQYRLDLLDGDGRVIGLMPASEVKFDDGDLVPRLLADGTVQATVTSGNAFSRRALEAVLPVPEEDFRIAADGYLVTATAFHGPVASLDDHLGAYRIHGANAWARQGRAGLVASLERGLAHDERRYAVLRAEAARRGLAVAPDLGSRDPYHLAAQLGLAVLDPGRAGSGPGRFDLAIRGARAAWAGPARGPFRAIAAAWFLAAGLLPRFIATHLVSWRLAPGSRPPGLARLFHRVREVFDAEGSSSKRHPGRTG